MLLLILEQVIKKKRLVFKFADPGLDLPIVFLEKGDQTVETREVFVVF